MRTENRLRFGSNVKEIFNHGMHGIHGVGAKALIWFFGLLWVFKIQSLVRQYSIRVFRAFRGLSFILLKYPRLTRGGLGAFLVV